MLAPPFPEAIRRAPDNHATTCNAMTKPNAPQPNVPMDDLRRIVKLMKDNELSEFEYESEGIKVKLCRAVAATFQPAALPAAAPVVLQQAHAPASPAPAAAAPAPVEEGTEITSPMVGTFYRSPAPEAEPFVKTGDSVSAGQTLCIIEAMKVMNEIKAEQSGVVVACVAADAKPVQFGEVLFRIR
jgi:acetyl-CoA carboxylase biotin carboxyl carrier protein